MPELPKPESETEEETAMRKSKNNWAMNHPKPSLTKNKPETAEKVLIDEDEILTLDEKTE